MNPGNAQPAHKPHVLTTVVEQHASEAGFLWSLRDAAVISSWAREIDVARLDTRVEAHLDALHIAGAEGLKIALSLLAEARAETSSASEVFVVASLAIRTQNFGVFAELLTQANYLTYRAAVSALAWEPHPGLIPWIQRLLTGVADSAGRHVGIAAGSAWRNHQRLFQDILPTLRRAVMAALTEPSFDLELSRRALDAVGECALYDCTPALQRYLESPEPEIRLAAARAAVLNGERRGVPMLAELASGKGRTAERAAALAVRGMDIAAAALLIRRMAADADSVRVSIVAAGALGDPTQISWLLTQMKSVEHARLAGESLALITGVDLEDAGLTQMQNTHDEDSAPESYASKMDEDLPWPNPEAVTAWWGANEKTIVPGQRYLMGAMIALPQVEAVLKIGTQRQRAAAAIEKALLGPQIPLAEVRAQNWRSAWQT